MWKIQLYLQKFIQINHIIGVETARFCAEVWYSVIDYLWFLSFNEVVFISTIHTPYSWCEYLCQTPTSLRKLLTEDWNDYWAHVLTQLLKSCYIKIDMISLYFKMFICQLNFEHIVSLSIARETDKKLHLLPEF
jgi:hypothetical protein